MSRDKELFKDSWFVQELLKEGEEKGVKKGMEKGAVQALRQTLVAMIQARFPGQVQLAEKLAKGAKDPAKLQDIAVRVGMVQDEQEVAQLLTELAPQTRVAKKGKQGE